jgi:hypothetical protein
MGIVAPVQTVVPLCEITVRPVCDGEKMQFRELMDRHHYLGFLPKIGNTIWYLALWQDTIVALLSFSASALRCGVREHWIGWRHRHQFDRLNLIANNSRFLILPKYHQKNLATRVLSLCQKRIQQDWLKHFGFPLLLLETFVDPTRYRGTIYKAANWRFLGYTKGFSRIYGGYSEHAGTAKMVFVMPLAHQTRKLLSAPMLGHPYKTGVPRMKLTSDHMKSLPAFFREIKDPRRAQARIHRLETVLAIAAAAILCGARGYNGIYDWARSLSPVARTRFQCRYKNGQYLIPSLSIIRDVLVRVDPQSLDRALQSWNEQHAVDDESLAIDGKTMRNAIDEEGRQVHIMSVIGHSSKQCYAQKKSANCLLMAGTS